MILQLHARRDMRGLTRNSKRHGVQVEVVVNLVWPRSGSGIRKTLTVGGSLAPDIS
jgi:hypothetical protein